MNLKLVFMRNRCRPSRNLIVGPGPVTVATRLARSLQPMMVMYFSNATSMVEGLKHTVLRI